MCSARSASSLQRLVAQLNDVETRLTTAEAVAGAAQGTREQLATARRERDAAKQESAVQSLALEMQRSMDYFESQLGLGAVSQLWMLKSDLVDVTDALGELEERVNTPVRLMSLESSFNRQEDDRPLTASLTVALGGALSYELGN